MPQIHPNLLTQMLGGAPTATPPPNAAGTPPDPFARPYDDAGAQRPDQRQPSGEEARIIEGLLKEQQMKSIYDLAMQDARRPAMYRFDRSGGLQGAVDSNKRLGYGALATLLNADADRYGENNRADMFRDEMEMRRMPFEQMTAADQDMADFRREELQQRAATAAMPYERMTPFEEGSLDVERQRANARDPLVEAFAPLFQDDQEVMGKIRSRIMGEKYEPPPLKTFQEQMADQVNDNEVSGIVEESIGKPRDNWNMSDYSKANKVTAETLFEQVRSGDRSYESALQAAKRSDDNPENPAGAASTVKTLTRKKETFDRNTADMKREHHERPRLYPDYLDNLPVQ